MGRSHQPAVRPEQQLQVPRRSQELRPTDTSHYIRGGGEVGTSSSLCVFSVRFLVPTSSYKCFLSLVQLGSILQVQKRRVSF